MPKPKAAPYQDTWHSILDYLVGNGEELPPVAPPPGRDMQTGLGPQVDRATAHLPVGDRNQLQGVIDRGRLHLDPYMQAGTGAVRSRFGDLYRYMEVNPEMVGPRFQWRSPVDAHSALVALLGHEIQHGRQPSGDYSPERPLPFPLLVPPKEAPPGSDRIARGMHDDYQRYWTSPDEIEARWRGSLVAPNRTRKPGPPNLTSRERYETAMVKGGPAAVSQEHDRVMQELRGQRDEPWWMEDERAKYDPPKPPKGPLERMVGMNVKSETKRLPLKPKLGKK